MANISNSIEHFHNILKYFFRVSMSIHKYSIRFQILYLLIESLTWLQHLIIKYSSLLCNIHGYLSLSFICTTTVNNFTKQFYNKNQLQHLVL